MAFRAYPLVISTFDFCPQVRRRGSFDFVLYLARKFPVLEIPVAELILNYSRAYLTWKFYFNFWKTEHSAMNTFSMQLITTTCPSLLDFWHTFFPHAPDSGCRELFLGFRKYHHDSPRSVSQMAKMDDYSRGLCPFLPHWSHLHHTGLFFVLLSQCSCQQTFDWYYIPFSISLYVGRGMDAGVGRLLWMCLCDCRDCNSGGIMSMVPIEFQG